MTSAGTTQPSRAWMSSTAPNYVTPPAFKNEDGQTIEHNPNIIKPTYDPVRPGGTIFTGRSFNTFKRIPESKVSSVKQEGSVAKKQKVRFSDSEPDRTDGREVVKTNVGGIVITTTKPYETLVAERDALLETETSYRKRVKELEGENAQILLDFEAMYKENNNLRDKLDKGDDTHIESYQRIYDDRKILREAETAYKKRIGQLEQDAADMLKNFDSLYTENKVLREGRDKLEDKINAIDSLNDIKKINELEKKVKQQAKTIRTLNYEREDLVKEKNEIENQMCKLREEMSEINRRNVLFQRENEGLKRGFEALGNDPDESWRKELRQKTRRQEEEERILREEHKTFKARNSELEKSNHKLEKENVEIMTINEMLQKDKADFERQIFELVKENRNRTPSAHKKRAAEKGAENEKRLEELTKKVADLQSANVKLTTANELFAKEKEQFESRLEQAAKQPRETASSIRRKMETEREIRDLTNHVETFKDKVKRLEAENKDLQEQLKKAEIEMKAHKQASKAIAEGQAGETESNIKGLNDKVIALNNEIKYLTDENLRLKTDYNALNEKLQIQIETITKEKERLYEDKQALENNINEATSSNTGKMQELQDELNSLQVELQILKPKHDTLQGDYEELKSVNLSITRSLDEKRQELEELRDTIRNNKDVYNELSKAQRENNNLKREMEDMNRKFENEKVKQEADLEELLKNQEFMNTALAEHKVRLDMLHEEKNELKSENLKLVKANERQSKQIVDFQKDAEKATESSSAQVNDLNEELKKTQKELKKNEKELIEKTQELEIVKNEKENQVNKLIKQMDKLKMEREIETNQLKEQSESLRSEVARLKIFEERIQNMEKNLKELLQKLTAAEERNKALTDKKLASLNQVVGEMKSENLANRLRAAEREENELEKYRMELEIKQDAINEIRRLKDENGRLLKVIEDKRAAEEAQDEWVKTKNKFNEVMAQNKRLEAENKRMLSLYDESKIENMKQDLQDKTEQLRLLESKYHSFSEDNAKLKQAVDDKEKEIKRIESKIDRTNKATRECNRLEIENKRLRDELYKKDNMITQLKELEVTSAKYMDSATNNQRLYEENMRLRETIEKSKDYKSEFQKLKGKEKDVALMQSKYAEENTLLRSTLQHKEEELKRDIELHKQRAENIQSRNKRLIDEVAKLKDDISKKDDLIIKLRDLETAQGKYKDANANVTRLYEENQRLRNLLESSGWKSNFQNAKSLKSDVSYSETRSEPQSAIFIDSNRRKEGKTSAEKQNKLLKRRSKQSSYDERVQSLTPESENGAISRKMKIKPLTKLPDIKKEESSLVFGLSYQELHNRTKGLKGEKLIEALNEEISQMRTKYGRKENELKHTNAELKVQRHDHEHLKKDNESLRNEIARLKKEVEVQSIGISLNKSSQLQEQNKRIMAENQRLRDELNSGQLTLATRATGGYTMATYMDTSHQTGQLASTDDDEKSTRDKLKQALSQNKRLSEENHRLRAAIDQLNRTDLNSRFADQNVAGKMIEGFQNSKQWASKVNKGTLQNKAKNETDDSKLLKLEDLPSNS